jgi:lysophospholipase L1-like esterase
MRSRGRTVLFALIPTLFVVLLAEIAVRAYDYVTQRRSSSARTSWYWLYERDPYLGYRGKPGVRQAMGPDEEIVHSPDGFRDARSLDEIGRMKDRHLVVAIGESSTYGLRSGDTAGTYPAQLEGALRRLSNDDRWVVFNAGQPGYTSHEVLVLTSLRLAKLRPTVVIAMNLRNDFVFVSHYLDQAVDYNMLPLKLAQRKGLWAGACSFSAACGLLLTKTLGVIGDDVGGRAPADTEHPPTPRSREQYKTNLALLSALADIAGFKLMLVDQPVNTAAWAAKDRDGLRALRGDLHEVAAARKVQLLDADAGFPWDLVTPGEDVHLGRAGYGALAERIAPQVLAACPGGRCS